MSNTTHFFAGLDSILLDNREFALPQESLEQVCRTFRIGKSKDCQKEKDVTVSHSNFYFFVATTRGRYALKFYPPGEEKSLTTELALNRLLIKQRFPTPAMLTSRSGIPFLKVNGRLATCFNFIDGNPAYQRLRHPSTIRKINEGAFRLKEIISTWPEFSRLLRRTEFSRKINQLVQSSRASSPFKQKGLIDKIIARAAKTYLDHRPFFTQKPIHNNLSLTNLLSCKDRIYFLDLSHIAIDYELSDLAVLVMSCLFLNVPAATIRKIIQSYLTVHELSSEKLTALTVLIELRLIKEYLKTVQQRKDIAQTKLKSTLSDICLSYIKKRENLIVSVIRTLAAGTQVPFYPTVSPDKIGTDRISPVGFQP